MKPVSIDYFVFKFALQQFGKSAHDLTDEQRFEVAEKSRAECKLHEQILCQPEAIQMVVEDETVDKAFEIIIKRYADQEEFQHDLENNNIDEQLLKNGLRNDLTVEGVLEIVGRSAGRVPEEEVREYYQQNWQKFTQPELRSVRQILITVDESGPEENRRKASYERLASIRTRLLSQSSDFGEEAANYSECPSALNSGLLGTFPRGKLYPQLDEALFSLEQKEISNIVETELGFHLLYCEEIQPAAKISWEQVGPRIREHLQKKCERNHVRDWLRRLEN